jgi:hypothetical protein
VQPEENILMHDDNVHAPDHGDIHLPPPSIWPLILALGLAMLAMGLVFRGPVLIVGLATFLLSLLGWIFEDELNRLLRRRRA